MYYPLSQSRRTLGPPTPPFDPPHLSPSSPSRLSSFTMSSFVHSNGIDPSTHTPSLSSSSQSYPAPPARPAFPKTAVVCGAHTELGKLVVRELLRSVEVDRVYALASIDPRDDIHIREHELPKLRLVVDSLDYIEHILKRSVDNVDIAFCCLGSSKQDLSTLGHYKFRKLNFDIPRRFVTQMFARGAQRIAILSHVGADVRSSSEFLRVKGELVQFVLQMQLEAGRYGPGVLLLRVPLLLTNLRDTNGLTGTKISTLDEIKQKAALKFDFGPSQAVHVRDVAKAMVADTIRNADTEEESDLTFRFKKQQVSLTELYGPDIVSLAQEVRALQRSSFSKGFTRGAGYMFLENVHGYGSEHGTERQYMDLTDGRSVLSGEGLDFQHLGQDAAFYPSGNEVYTSEHEDKNLVLDHHTARIECTAEESLLNGGRARGRRSSLPASKTHGVIESAVDSVQALARQLKKPIAALESDSLGLQGQSPKRRARLQRPAEPIAHNVHNVQFIRNDLPERTYSSQGLLGKQDNLFTRHQNDSLGVFLNSSDSLSSRTQVNRSGMQEVRRPYFSNTGEDYCSTLMFGRSALSDELEQFLPESVDLADQYTSAFSSQRSRPSRIPPEQEFYGGGPNNIYQEGSEGRHENYYGEVEQKSAMERFANLIGRAISATDRPSTQRSYKTRRPASQPEEPLVRQTQGNGDMRALGETSI